MLRLNERALALSRGTYKYAAASIKVSIPIHRESADNRTSTEQSRHRDQAGAEHDPKVAISVKPQTLVRTAPKNHIVRSASERRTTLHPAPSLNRVPAEAASECFFNLG